MMKQRVENLPERIKTRRQKVSRTKEGLLSNAFTSSKWNSRIKSANTTKKEMWLGYVLGPYGMLLGQSVVNSYFNQYLTDILGLTVSKGAWIATFMVLFPVVSKLVDAITNLVMAKVIDSTTCRQGKVRPWLLISAPLVTISIILLFWMPFSQPIHQAIWVVFAYNLYYSVAYTMWNMSKELSAAVSTRNVNQRKNLSMAASITMNIGTGMVSIIFPMILTAVCAAVHGNNAEGYLLTMSIVACISLPLTFVQYFYTRERVTEERRNQVGIEDKAKAEKIGTKKEASMLSQLKACMKTKYWILFVLIILIWNTLANMRNISLVYYCGWVVNGNAYGSYATIQAKFQMIAMSPMGPGVLILLPLMKKFGRTKCIWMGGILTTIGSVIAYLNPGSGMMIYMGSALAAFGNIAFSYVILTFVGDLIDHVEWKTGVRCDGLTGGTVSAVMMFAVGIAQGIFNLGLMATGYMQPQQVGVSPSGVALFADQNAAATGWINFAYQGSYIIIGLMFFFIFCFVFRLEYQMPQVSKELQDRKIADCAKLGIEYIPADVLQKREIEEQEREAEEIRIKELKEKCQKKGLNFEVENKKILDKREAKRVKAEKKAAKKNK